MFSQAHHTEHNKEPSDPQEECKTKGSNEGSTDKTPEFQVPVESPIDEEQQNEDRFVLKQITCNKLPMKKVN